MLGVPRYHAGPPNGTPPRLSEIMGYLDHKDVLNSRVNVEWKEAATRALIRNDSAELTCKNKPLPKVFGGGFDLPWVKDFQQFHIRTLQVGVVALRAAFGSNFYHSKIIAFLRYSS